MQGGILSGNGSTRAEIKAWGGRRKLSPLKTSGLYIRPSLCAATEYCYVGVPQRMGKALEDPAQIMFELVGEHSEAPSLKYNEGMGLHQAFQDIPCPLRYTVLA